MHVDKVFIKANTSAFDTGEDTFTDVRDESGRRHCCDITINGRLSSTASFCGVLDWVGSLKSCLFKES